MTRATLLLATLLGTLSLGAVAQTDDTTTGGVGTGTTTDTTTETGTTTGTGTGLTFSDLDTNSDGRLDEDEIDESLDFDEMDQNDDGEVDRNEFMQYQSMQGR